MGAAIPQIASAAEDRASGAQVIDGSLRFLQGLQNTAYATYFKRTPSSDGNRRTYTLSVWCKRTTFKGADLGNGYTVNSFAMCGANDFRWLYSSDSGGDVITAYDATMSGGCNQATSAQYRDSDWYHVVLAVDTTQSTSSNRVKIYVNGKHITVLSTDTKPNQDAQGDWNDASYVQYVGQIGTGSVFDGYLSQFYHIDGQALDASYFGYTDPLTNTWRPKKYTGNYNIVAAGTPVLSGDTALTWGSGTQGTGWALSNSDKTATYTPGSSAYASVYTQSLNASTTYSFTLTVTAADNYCGWFFQDAAAFPGGDGYHPDQRGGDSMGLRANESSLGTYGTFATANSTSDGQNQISGFGDVDPINGAKIDFVIDMSNRKVWVKAHTATGWIGGGDPTNTSSTASLLLPSGAIYFGCNGYTTGFVYVMDPLVTASATGVNSFYLPFDGNSPIGKDKSGKGNDFTPVNLGGSNIIPKATGALPILNTTNGGNVATVGVRTDAYANDLVLALPLVGNANDVSNQINSGSTTKTVTVDGATATSTASNFYGGSFDFDGSNDDLTWSITGGLGSGDFTIEYWVYQDTLSDYQTHFSSTRGSTGFNVGTDASGDFVWYSSSARQIEVVGAITTGRWYHWAFVRSGSTITGYLDGVEQASFSSSTDFSASAFSLGALDGNGEHTNGKFSDARIYVGTAKYTSDFIPASTNPNILPETPSGVAYSSELTQATAGAVYFDGTGDYCSTGSSSDFTMGTGDFTVECFITKDDSSHRGIWQISSTSGGLQSGSYTQTLALGYQVNRWQLYAGGSQVDGSQPPTNGLVIPKKWYHLSVVRNSGTTKLYVDGREEISTSDTYDYTGTYMAFGGYYNTSYLHYGNISNLRVIKGTALYTANFTPPTSPLTSITNTKLLCCQSNKSATAYTTSPGAISATGNVAASTLNPFDTDIDTVRGKPTGYCTLNPLWSNSTQTNGNNPPLFKDGNLAADYQAGTPSGNYFKSALGTIGVNSTKGGKWYFETTAGGGQYCQIGMVREDYQYMVGKDGWGLAGSTRGLVYQAGGSFSIDKGTVHTSLTTWTTYGQMASFLIDFDNKKVNAWVDGVDVGYTVDITSYLSDISPIWYPAISVGDWSSLTNDETMYVNFGQKPFKFIPPEGYQPICAANSPSPGMTRPDQYYGISLYTGDGTSPRKIGGFGFQPDLVWYKERSEARDWQVYDSVRGVGPAKNLVTNTTYAQTANDDTSYGYTSSFNRDGFTVTDGTGGGNANIYTNKNGQTYASWCWKAGGNKNTFNIDDVGYSTAAAAGLTGGTITPTGASVGTKQGFSIIKTNLPGSNTASTFSHGLTQAPDFALVKPTGVNFQWDVYHKSLGKDAYLVLNTTAAQVTGATTVWNSTDPTSSVFHLGDAWTGGVGTNQPVIAYLWHDVPGVQKFGSYTGNQNTNGPYVEIGFKPALLIIKSSSASSTNWRIIDNTRRPYNWGANDSTSQGGPWLKINSNAAEANERPVDLLSNGFKIQGAWGGDINYDGGTPTYIYMAWAESPMHNLYGGQSNAR